MKINPKKFRGVFRVYGYGDRGHRLIYNVCNNEEMDVPLWILQEVIGYDSNLWWSQLFNEVSI